MSRRWPAATTVMLFGGFCLSDAGHLGSTTTSGILTARYAAKALGHRSPGLGLASWGIGRSEVFVLPGTSGANQRRDYDGRPNRLAWWSELAGLASPELAAR